MNNYLGCHGGPRAKGRGWALAQVTHGGVARPGVSAPKGAAGKRIFDYSLRTPRWRRTEWDEGVQGRELYDQDTDMQELVNLAGKSEHARTVAPLSEQLRTAVKTTFPADGKTPELKEGLWDRCWWIDSPRYPLPIPRGASVSIQMIHVLRPRRP